MQGVHFRLAALVFLPLSFAALWVFKYASGQRVPYRNNMIYLGVAAAVAGMALVSSRLTIKKRLEELLLKSNKEISTEIPWWVVAACACVYTLTAFYRLELSSSPVGDHFHEAEYFAYLPAFLLGKNFFSNAFTFHGFGGDVLPSVLGYLWGGSEQTLIYTRLAIMLQGLVTWLGSAWVLWELASFSGTKNRKPWFICSLILFQILDGWTYSFVYGGPYHPPVRPSGFVLELALLLTAIRRRSLVWAAIGGALVVVGCLYNYTFGVTFFAATLFSFGWAFCGSKEERRWGLFGLVGVFIGAVSLGLLIGFDQLVAAVDQVLVLARKGKTVQMSHPIPIIHFILSGLVVVLSWKWIFQSVRQRKADRIVLAAALLLIHMLLNSDYGMHHVDHLFLSGISTTFLFLFWIQTRQGNLILIPSRKKGMALVLLLWGLSNMAALNPKRLVQKVTGIQKTLQLKDEKLFSEEIWSTRENLKNELKTAECLYDFDTSMLSMYFVLQKPACSRFYAYTHALIFGDEARVDQDLRQKKSVLVMADPKNTEAQYRAHPFFVGMRPLRHIGPVWFWVRP